MKTMLKEKIDWEIVMKMSRCAGGHVSIMQSLFKNATIIVEFIENDYQGTEGFIYQLDDEFIFITDYFGSCSGCDAWEDATDEEARNMCIQLANNAQRFDSFQSLFNFLEVEVEKDKGSYYGESLVSKELLKELKKNIVLMREHNIDELLD